MEIFKWQDKFDVGIDGINNQHKKLIEMLNGLFEAMAVGKSKEVIDQLLNDLAKYGIEHFDSEEKLFEKYNYSGAKKHIEEHLKFKATVTELLENQAKGSTMVSMDTMRFLKEWVTHHILEIDMRYKDQLK